MSQHKQFNDTNIKATSKTVWFAMQASVPMLLVLVFFMNKLSLLDPILPDLKNVFVIICIASIVTPFTFLGYFKRIQNKVRDNLRLGMDNEPAELQRYFSFLLVGMSLCNLSSMFGFILYLIAGDYFYSLFFITISFFLGFLYKPELK